MTIVVDKVVEELVTQGVNALVQTVAENLKLIRGIESEINDLTADIEMFNARLVEASKNPKSNDHQVLRLVVKEFRTIVNEAQDSIADYFVLKGKKGDKNALSKSLDKIPFCGKINDHATVIHNIRAKLEKIRQLHEQEILYLMQYKLKDQNKPPGQTQARPRVDNMVIAFKDNLKAIKSRLLEVSNNFVVIPIDGMPGVGETTFASMLFEDPDIRNNFVYHIWVPVSICCDRKQIFINIVCQITGLAKSYFSTISDEMLEDTIQSLLKDQKYFIVLDDVWKRRDWDSVRTALPKNSNGSAILVTSRYINEVDAVWERVIDYPINGDRQSYIELLMLRYNELPDEKFKICLLYFAFFPMGYEIATRELVLLWIAEEFIPKADDKWGYPIDQKVEAQKYLNELIDRNLVMVIKRRTDGQIQTCCINGIVHEFCKNQAAREHLFHVMNAEQRLDKNTCSTSRLCYHNFSADRFYQENESSRWFLNKGIHSLLMRSTERGDGPFAQIIQKRLVSRIPNTFPHLRVLHIEFIKSIYILPKELFNLYLLKYLSIEGNFNLLPISFKNLGELETLVIKTTSRTLRVDGGIWNMVKLKHVYTNTSVQLPFPLKTNSATIDILTLSTIAPTSCIEEIFRKTPKLQKLGIRGDLSKLLENDEFGNNLEKLECLENLKLYGQQYDKMLTFPRRFMFPRRLKKVTISGTKFEWKYMFILGLLGDLEVLKLDEYAFNGEEWMLIYQGIVFKRLQYLRIGKTNLVSWKATEDSFPALRRLVLRNCSSLQRIPEAFANVHTLKVIELFHMSETAVESMKEVKEKAKNSALQLIITPRMREGPVKTDMETMILQQSVSEAVIRLDDFHFSILIYSFKWSGFPRGLLRDLVRDIRKFNERLEKACIASVNVLIVIKNFQTILNEAHDAASNFFLLTLDYEAKAFTKFLIPRYRREVKSCENEIKSLRTKVTKILQEYKNNLQSPQIERSTVFDKLIEEVEQTVNTLHKTVEDNVVPEIIKDTTSQIKTFTDNLVKACNNPKANEHPHVLRGIVKEFRILVNEAKDVVDNYFALDKKKHGENAFSKSLGKILLHCGKVNVYESEFQSIKAKLQTILKHHKRDLAPLLEYKSSDQPPPKPSSVIQEKQIVGFNDDLKTIKTQLMEVSENFIVIPIVGNVGTGKTTIALEIFEDPEIRKIFTHCIWVHVSKGFHRKQTFIDILHQISKHAENFSLKSEDLLEAKVKELLEDERYLIVLDDVREKKDWDSLKVVFLENLKGSRALVTTSSGNVVDSTWKAHTLGKLSNDDGWLLIKNNVFGKEGCNDTLFEELGKEIAKKCNGLPHALVFLAGILRNYRTYDGWQRVADNRLLEINPEDQGYHKLVKLSYNDLPHENLQNAFLYFACFPMGHEIAAWKLIHLWIAENFIRTEDEVQTEASKYLNILVDRNLVMVRKRRADGEIKTCCVHDTLHEFCRSEAERKKLFHVMDEGQRLEERCYLDRLCSYYTMNIFDVENNPPDAFFNLFNKRMGPRQRDYWVKSLLLSSSQKSEIHSTPQQLETILKTFKCLHVLNIESLKFRSLPNELYSQYSWIRYLAITADINSLPKSFENLSYLQTLVIKTTERELQINGGIWNMEDLRHVHTNTSTQLPSPPKTGKHSRGKSDILTLSTISPGSCTNKIFSKTPKLQKLGVRGDLSELLKEEKQQVCLFNNIQMLDCLENLKLHGNSENVVLKVPMLDKFPRRLRKLTFSGTLFQWNDITVLGSLEKLEVLKLDENAFSGEQWDLSSDVIFTGLKYLRIGKTNLVTWTAVEKSFPVLESLVFRNCTSLESIPHAFANVESLKVMELFDSVSQRVVDSATNICVQRQGKTTIKMNGFKIFISPLPSQPIVHFDENVNTSEFDIPSTSTLSQEIKQAYGKENGFDVPSTSTSQEIVNQAYGKENGFDVPSTSTSQEINQAYGKKNVNTNEFDVPSTSTSQEIVCDD